MGHFIRWIALGVVSAGTGVWAQDPPADRLLQPDQNANKRPASASVAVVELFTSQGCESCPPADELLSNLPAEHPQHASQIFTLGYHVEMWDKLGWVDPFGLPDATRRHRAYTRFLLGSLDDPKAPRPAVYTPAMIVNGRRMFVGSDAASAKAAIAEALKTPALVSVSATIDPASLPQRPQARRDSSATPSGPAQPDVPAASWLLTPGGDAIVVDVAVRAIDHAAWPASIEPDKIVAIAALVENGVETEVTAGENEGKTLKHSSVVRAFAVERAVMVPTIPKNAVDGQGGIAGGSGTPLPGEAPQIPVLESRVRFRLRMPAPEAGLARPPMDLTKASVVVFVADEKDWRVMGANRFALGK